MRGSYKTRLRIKRKRQKIKKRKLLKKQLRLAKANMAKSDQKRSNKTNRRSSKSSYCYMCDKEASSVEHVPPKCLFPKKADVKDGINYRQQLITVPSCEEHNTAKSTDDEYILYILVMNIFTNHVGKKQLSTKIARAVKARPKLMISFLDNQKEVFLKAKDSSSEASATAVKVNLPRFNSAIETLTRALYFHHYNEKCCGAIIVHPDFIPSLGTKNSIEVNRDISELSTSIEKYFEDNEKFGSNADVFYYQVTKPTTKFDTIFKLVFYGECSISVLMN